MCAVRSRPTDQPLELLLPSRAFRSRTKARTPANDNRTREAYAWRSAGRMLGAAAVGYAALGLALLGL